jgi:hypothetical protein
LGFDFHNGIVTVGLRLGYNVWRIGEKLTRVLELEEIKGLTVVAIQDIQIAKMVAKK